MTDTSRTHPSTARAPHRLCGPVSWLGVGLVLVVSGTIGCSFKLVSMAKTDAADVMHCDQLRARSRPGTPPDMRITVSGCDEFRLYRGNCDGEHNGCDNLGFDDPACNGSCRVDLEDHGSLLPPEPETLDDVLGAKEEPSGAVSD